MGAKTLLSLEEFMALPEDGNQYELNHGELITMPPPSRIHILIIWQINLILSRFVNEQQLGKVFSEAGYRLSGEPEVSYREPDVSFVSKERLRTMADSNFLEGAPELAVEVVSPSELAADLHLKVRQYLQAGGKEVWVVYPDTRSVTVYKAGGQVVELPEIDTLTSDLFPGWSARVADFFDLDS